MARSLSPPVERLAGEDGGRARLIRLQPTWVHVPRLSALVSELTSNSGRTEQIHRLSNQVTHPLKCGHSLRSSGSPMAPAI